MRVIPQLLLLCFVPRLQGVTAKSNKHQPVNVLAVHGGIKQAERKRQLSRKQPAVTEQVVNTSDAAQSETSFVSEILSGTTVALASIPSSIAFANIAGLDPLVGVWSSVILGTVSSLTGLRPGLVAGAAGVVAVPLASVVKNSGKQYVGPTIVLASLMELAFSLAKGGRLIDLVRYVCICASVFLVLF
jgi:MFS superfamily sulfate permease-like transporter